MSGRSVKRDKDREKNSKLYEKGIQPWWLDVLIRQFSHSVEERLRHTVDRITLGAWYWPLTLLTCYMDPLPTDLCYKYK